MYGIIYKVTNLKNEKIYIGQTIKSLNKRIKGHRDIFKKSNNIFHKALKKYGFENFNWCIIDQAYSQGELDYKEIYWINYYKSYIGLEICFGYNSTTGGKEGYHFSELTLEKMSKSQKTFIEINGHPKGMLGKNHSKETIENFKRTRKGKNNGNSKSIIKLDKKSNIIKEYDTIQDASNDLQLGINAVPHISSCCKDKLKTAYGYIWMYKEDYIKNGVKILKIHKNKKSIIQLTVNNEFVEKFESIKDASIKISASPKSLWKCLNGKTKTCKGYIWIYENDYKKEID